jgi:hypothetical protein
LPRLAGGRFDVAIIQHLGDAARRWMNERRDDWAQAFGESVGILPALSRALLGLVT